MGYSVALINVDRICEQMYPKVTIKLVHGLLIEWFEQQVRYIVVDDNKIIRPLPSDATLMYFTDEESPLEHTEDEYGVRLFYVESKDIPKIIDWLEHKGSTLKESTIKPTLDALNYMTLLPGYLILYWY